MTALAVRSELTLLHKFQFRNIWLAAKGGFFTDAQKINLLVYSAHRLGGFGGLLDVLGPVERTDQDA